MTEAEINGLKQSEAALRQERDALRKQHVEDEEFIDYLGQVVCGVAFTNGQYEEANEYARTHSECAFCGEFGPRTPEAMAEHLPRCTKRPEHALFVERDNLKANLTQVLNDMREISIEDERGHALIDAADNEDPDTSSMCTLADRVGRLVGERDEALARLAERTDQLEALVLSREAMGAEVERLKAERDAAYSDADATCREWKAAIARADQHAAEAAMLREAVQIAMRLEHHSQPEYGRMKAMAKSALEPGASAQWLAEHDAKVRERIQAEADEHWNALKSENDAEIWRRALEEAGDIAEDWTCKNCDCDTASDLAMAIRALDKST